MNGDTVAVIVLALLYFVVLIVVAWEPHEPARRGRHRRDLAKGAR
ncbi:MAG: hypothetical protein ACRDSL_18510 [Pseudonocardiaceae bacterium]